MSILAPPSLAPWPMPPYPVRRFSVDEYHQMIQGGILSEDDPVELLEGWIIQKMPHNPPHGMALLKTARKLTAVLPETRLVRQQLPITTDESEPEPDISVVPGPEDRYPDRHPGPEEIDLFVEVADTTLARDRGQKGRLYARARIACYWIVNLQDRQIEVYILPGGTASSPAYQQRKDYLPGDSVPVIIAGQLIGSIPVNDLLPPP